jgi:hypothetical protein
MRWITIIDDVVLVILVEVKYERMYYTWREAPVSWEEGVVFVCSSGQVLAAL